MMMIMVGSKVLFFHFARLLDYPTQEIKQQVSECSSILGKLYPKANDELAGFYTYIIQEPLGMLEETYTKSFDLQGVCYPYLGHHLFGESYKRSWFMARLNEAYRETGFNPGNELPDHLVVVLRFLAQGNDDEFSHVLQNEGLIPAVDIMQRAFSKNGRNPYRPVFKVLSMVLHECNLVYPGDLFDSKKEG